MSARSTKSTDEQLQIGDYVIYSPEGVFARIVGYVWIEPLGELPSISRYSLSVGISVPRSVLTLLPANDPENQKRFSLRDYE